MKSPWWIVFAGCIAHAFNTGLSYFGLSAYFPFFEREFGWSRTAISGAFSLAKIEAGLLGPIEGYVTDRLGPRRIMFFGIGLMATGFLVLSTVDSLPLLYAAIVLGIVMGSSRGYNVPISLIIANVFREEAWLLKCTVWGRASLGRWFLSSAGSLVFGAGGLRRSFQPCCF